MGKCFHSFIQTLVIEPQLKCTWTKWQKRDALSGHCDCETGLNLPPDQYIIQAHVRLSGALNYTVLTMADPLSGEPEHFEMPDTLNTLTLYPKEGLICWNKHQEFLPTCTLSPTSPFGYNGTCCHNYDARFCIGKRTCVWE